MSISRSTTPDEIEAGALSLHKRLGRALDALDAGDVSAADDLATVLRTLVADGNGNKMIRRLSQARGVPIGDIFASQPPEQPDRILLAVGHLPILRDTPGARGQNRTFEQWIGATSVLTPATRRNGRPWTGSSWRDFANMAGNTTGSHLSTTIPEILDQSRFAGAAGLTLHHYLLRQMAWQVETLLGAMLTALGREVRNAQRPISFHNTLIGLITFFEMPPGIRANCELVVDSFPAEVLTFDFDGHYELRVNEDGNAQFLTPSQ